MAFFPNEKPDFASQYSSEGYIESKVSCRKNLRTVLRIEHFQAVHLKRLPASLWELSQQAQGKNLRDGMSVSLRVTP